MPSSQRATVAKRANAAEGRNGPKEQKRREDPAKAPAEGAWVKTKGFPQISGKDGVLWCGAGKRSSLNPRKIKLDPYLTP